jgi:hypothetical protein
MDPLYIYFISSTLGLHVGFKDRNNFQNFVANIVIEFAIIMFYFFAFQSLFLDVIIDIHIF